MTDIPKPRLSIEYVAITDLLPSEYTPRKLSKKAYAKLRSSITKHGLIKPLIVNSSEKRKNVIIEGHQRFYICKQLNFTEVPVVYLDIPELEREQELNVGFNKLGGDFDVNMLANIDEAVLMGAGYDKSELQRIFELAMPKVEPEIDFTTELLEENNYIVFVFNNTLDWQVARDAFELGTVHALDSRADYSRAGVGRVVDGKKLLGVLGNQK